MVRALRKTDLEQVMELWLDTNTRAHDFIPARYWAYRREGFGLQSEGVDENTGEAELHLVWECRPGVEQ